MKKYLNCMICIVFCSFYIACNTSTEANNEEVISEVTPSESDEKNDATAEIDEVEKTPVENYLSILREQWKDTPNPIVAKFESAELHDYFHLLFRDAEGNGYDFADGNNDLGDYVLYDEDYTGNKKYIGKEFEIKWEWKMSEFVCCDGMMENVEGEIPSIVNIQLK